MLHYRDKSDRRGKEIEELKEALEKVGGQDGKLVWMCLFLCLTEHVIHASYTRVQWGQMAAEVGGQ